MEIISRYKKIESFQKLLQKYCDLSIFKNASFVEGITLDWACSIEIDGKSPQENFELGKFSCIPGGFKSHFKHPPYRFPLELSGQEIKDRENAKVIIRRIFLKNETTNIWKALDVIFHFDFSSDGVKDMIIHALTYSPIGFGESYAELEDDFELELKIGNYLKTITKVSLDKELLTYLDIFILFLHGDYMHGD